MRLHTDILICLSIKSNTSIGCFRINPQSSINSLRSRSYFSLDMITTISVIMLLYINAERFVYSAASEGKLKLHFVSFFALTELFEKKQTKKNHQLTFSANLINCCVQTVYSYHSCPVVCYYSSHSFQDFNLYLSHFFFLCPPCVTTYILPI